MIPSPRLVTTDTLACGPPIWITASCKVSTLRWDIAGGDGGGGGEKLSCSAFSLMTICRDADVSL